MGVGLLGTTMNDDPCIIAGWRTQNREMTARRKKEAAS